MEEIVDAMSPNAPFELRLQGIRLQCAANLQQILAGKFCIDQLAPTSREMVRHCKAASYLAKTLAELDRIQFGK